MLELSFDEDVIVISVVGSGEVASLDTGILVGLSLSDVIDAVL